MEEWKEGRMEGRQKERKTEWKEGSKEERKQCIKYRSKSGRYN